MHLAARKPISAFLIYPLLIVIALAAGCGLFREDNSDSSPINDFSLPEGTVERGESIGPSGAAQVDAGEYDPRHQNGMVRDEYLGGGPGFSSASAAEFTVAPPR